MGSWGIVPGAGLSEQTLKTYCVFPRLWYGWCLLQTQIIQSNPLNMQTWSSHALLQSFLWLPCASNTCRFSTMAYVGRHKEAWHSTSPPHSLFSPSPSDAGTGDRPSCQFKHMSLPPWGCPVLGCLPCPYVVFQVSPFRNISLESRADIAPLLLSSAGCFLQWTSNTWALFCKLPLLSIPPRM